MVGLAGRRVSPEGLVCVLRPPRLAWRPCSSALRGRLALPGSRPFPPSRPFPALPNFPPLAAFLAYLPSSVIAPAT